jgi:hypothetical protein
MRTIVGEVVNLSEADIGSVEDINTVLNMVRMLTEVDALPESLRTAPGQQAFLQRVATHQAFRDIERANIVGQVGLDAILIGSMVATGGLGDIAAGAVLTRVGLAVGRHTLIRTVAGQALTMGINAPVFSAGMAEIEYELGLREYRQEWDEFVVGSLFTLGVLASVRGGLGIYKGVASAALGGSAPSTLLGRGALGLGGFTTEVGVLTLYGSGEQSFEAYIRDRDISGIWEAENLAGTAAHNFRTLLGLKGGNRFISRGVHRVQDWMRIRTGVPAGIARNAGRLEVYDRTLRNAQSGLSSLTPEQVRIISEARDILIQERTTLDRQLASMGGMSEQEFIRRHGEEGRLSPKARELENWLRAQAYSCLLYTSPSPRDRQKSRMPSSA